MDFTREPIIETVITPKEGHKLVIRSSKAVGQEEFFVDALEVVSFGQNLFFRSLEKPKAFLVPTNDYEVLEVREARMVLKHVGLERAIKIGGGKEAGHKNVREVERDIPPPPPPVAVPAEAAIAAPADAPIAEEKGEGRFERKRERRRQYRRRRGREEGAPREGEVWTEGNEEGDMPIEEEAVKIPLAAAPHEQEVSHRRSEAITASSSILTSLLPPPSTLISETLARYRENDMFKDAFFFKEQAVERNIDRGDEKEAEAFLPLEQEPDNEAHIAEVHITEEPPEEEEVPLRPSEMIFSSPEEPWTQSSEIEHDPLEPNP